MLCAGAAGAGPARKKMARLSFETGHAGSRYHSNCAFPHLFRHCHALCADAAVTGDAYWGTPFGSPAQKRWDEASARRFTPIPALCGASRCSVFVTACMKLPASYHRAEPVSRGNLRKFCISGGFPANGTAYPAGLAGAGPGECLFNPRRRRCTGSRSRSPRCSGCWRCLPDPG